MNSSSPVSENRIINMFCSKGVKVWSIYLLSFGSGVFTSAPFFVLLSLGKLEKFKEGPILITFGLGVLMTFIAMALAFNLSAKNSNN